MNTSLVGKCSSNDLSTTASALRSSSKIRFLRSSWICQTKLSIENRWKSCLKRWTSRRISMSWHLSQLNQRASKSTVPILQEWPKLLIHKKRFTRWWGCTRTLQIDLTKISKGSLQIWIRWLTRFKWSVRTSKHSKPWSQDSRLSFKFRRKSTRCFWIMQIP